MAKAMSFRLVGGIILAAHSADPPSEEEWAQYCTFCAGLPLRCNRYLIYTDGGGPNAAQRSEAPRILKARGHPDAIVAVVTRAPMVRGIVTALSWFNPKIKTFLPVDLGDALRYLGAAAAESAEIKVELRKLQGDLILR